MTAESSTDVREMLSKLPRSDLEDLRNNLEKAKAQKAKIEKADLRHIKRVFGVSFKELSEYVSDELTKQQ